MEKDKIFFSPENQGLTTTSANHIANLCKEAYMALEKELDEIQFVNSSVKLISSDSKNVLSEGITEVDSLQPKLLRIAQLKSLIAWLREAIKAKERLISEAKNLTFADLDIETPITPTMPTYLTEDDVVAEWGIKQRNRYYYLETLCAEFGQYIHQDGAYSNARKGLMDAIQKPNKVSGSGRDALLYSYTPSIQLDKVEDMYMKLQNEYRGYQAELNSMKHEVQTKVEQDKAEKDLKFKEIYEAYSLEMVKLNNQLRTIKNKKVKEIQDLKIIIPDSLKDIYEEVSKLGKK